MTKLLSILVVSLFFTDRANGQLPVTVLDTIHTHYEDVKVASSGTSLVCLNSNYDLELRTYNGNDFGSVQSATGLAGFYDKLEVIGFYAYAVGYNIKAIDISNPLAPVAYPETFFTTGFKSTAHWDNLLFSLSNIDGATHKLQVFTLFYPTSPQLADTMTLPSDGTMKVFGNKLYYFWSNPATGDRIRIYTLSNSAPYVSLTDSIVLNNSTNVSLPTIDITGSQMLAKTTDSLYRFRIGIGGDLQLLSRSALTLHVFNMVAIDTNTLCYADAGAIHVHQLHSDVLTRTDSVSGFSYFHAMGRLGSNVFYSGGGRTVLVGINNDITGVRQIPHHASEITISPNPSSDHWRVKSMKDGILQLYAIDGKLIQQSNVVAGKARVIDARLLASGVYLYRIYFNDHGTAAGKLIKE